MTSLEFAPDRRTLLSVGGGYGDHSLVFWEVATGVGLGETAGFSIANYLPGGKRVIASADDLWRQHGVCLLSAPTGAMERTLPGFPSGGRVRMDAYSCRSMAASASTDQVAAGITDGRIFCWDAKTSTLRWSRHVDATDLDSLAFSPDGRMLAAGTWRGTVHILEARTGRPLRAFTAHAEAVTSVAFFGNSRLIATGSGDGTVRLWDPARGRLLVTLMELPSPDGWIAYTPDGHFTGSPDADRFIRWRVGSEVIASRGLIERFRVPGLLKSIVHGR